MNKYISIIIAFCLGASLLTGCGGQKNTKEQPKAEAQTEAAQAEAAENAGKAQPAEAEAQAIEAAEQTDAVQAGDRQKAAESFEEIDAPTDGYIIFVKDAETNEPVAGAKVQFCSDTQCMMRKTDNTGAAVFDQEPGNYEAHILKVPEGYQKSNETINLTADNRMAVFMILKEGKEADAAGGEGSEVNTEETASKEADDGIRKSNAEWSFDMTGFTFKIPAKYSSYKGQLHGADFGETDFFSNIYYTYLFYLPRTDEERKALEDQYAAFDNGGEVTQEQMQSIDEYYQYNLCYAVIIAAKNDLDSEEAIQAVCGDAPVLKTGEIAATGEFNYYYVIPDYSEFNDMLREKIPEELYAEYEDVMAHAEEDILNNVTVTGARRDVEVPGTGTSFVFETTDLEGNAVSSGDLFAGHKVTMINLWATWCHVCKEELAALEELSKELAEKDCQIIGVCTDAIDDESAALAAQILEENGVTYTNIRATEEMLDLMAAPAMPSTYFVDSEGNVLTSPVKGADFEKYRQRIEEALGVLEIVNK